MLAISLSNIISSLATAFVTIPMPSDTLYSYAGPSSGTTGTCVAQGLFQIIGTVIEVGVSIFLHLYYLCTLGFNMPESMYERWIEPVCFYLFIPATVILLTVKLVTNDLINPTPFEPYCSFASYPYRCGIDDSIECIRGNDSELATFPAFVTGVSACFGIMSLSMLTILWKVHKIDVTNRLAKSLVSVGKKQGGENKTSVAIDKDNEDCESAAHNREDDHQNSESAHVLDYLNLGETNDTDISNGLVKSVTMQALMYESALFLSWGFTLLAIIAETNPNTIPLAETRTFQALKVFFQPIRGLFHMLIFIYHKVVQIRRVDKDLDSTWEALKILYREPQTIPEIVISRIELLNVKEYQNMLILRTTGDIKDDKLSGEKSIISFTSRISSRLWLNPQIEEEEQSGKYYKRSLRNNANLSNDEDSRNLSGFFKADGSLK